VPRFDDPRDKILNAAETIELIERTRIINEYQVDLAFLIKAAGEDYVRELAIAASSEPEKRARSPAERLSSPSAQTRALLRAIVQEVAVVADRPLSPNVNPTGAFGASLAGPAGSREGRARSRGALGALTRPHGR
jgi:hypothetical protein